MADLYQPFLNASFFRVAAGRGGAVAAAAETARALLIIFS
jgi:hypothetical protein